MYLSKVLVPWSAVKNPYQLHRELWKLFPGRPDDERNFMFRVETIQKGHSATVLMQSAWQPEDTDITRLVASKQVQLNVSEGMWLRFRLRANPIKTIKDEYKRLDRRGKIKSSRVPLVREMEQVAWIQRKLGDAVKFDSIQVTKEEPMFFRKHSNQAARQSEHSGKIQPVCFEGIFQVTDSNALQSAIQHGVGPAKSFGCGMLSIAPVPV